MPATRIAPTSLRAITVATLAALSVLALLVLGLPAHATPSAAELDKQIQTKSQEFNKAVEAYDKVQTDLSASKKSAAKLERKIKPLKVKVDAAQRKVGTMAAAAYRGGKASALNSVLTNGSASTMLDSMSLLNQMARAQSEQISALVKAKKELDAQKKKLDLTIARQNKQKKDLAAKKSGLDKDVNKLRNLRVQAYGEPVTTASRGNYGPPPEIPGSAGKAVAYAWNALGAPYQYGAAGPDSYDCSGLTMAAWSAAGYSLPHNTNAQLNATHRINRGDLQPGDLVFYYNTGHVGIYIGNGTVIHAPTEGEPVQKAGVDSMPANAYGRVG